MIVSSVSNNLTRNQEVLLTMPSGNGLQIIIIPNDLETYDRDTITVNVPATGTLTTTATVPYKIHRVHFVVRGEPATSQPVPVGQDPQAVGTRLANVRVELVEANPVMYPAIKHPATSPGGTAASVAGQPWCAPPTPKAGWTSPSVHQVGRSSSGSMPRMDRAT
jgi:hypothetical protein